MDNQKHTPGPWKVEHSFGEMTIRDSEDYPIATMTDEDTLPEAKANAELIASAPLLQDELNRAVLQSAVYLKEIKELKQKNKEQNGRIDALTELLKSMRPYVGQIQIPHGSMFLKEIKVLLKSETK